MKQKVLFHFQKVDPIIYEAAKKYGPFEDIQPRQPREYFSILCSEIINQQLSDKAGASIKKRFLNLFPRKNATVDHVLNISDQAIRDVGMSWSKVGFVKDLAQKTKNKEVKFSQLSTLDDKTVMQELTKIKGVGPWTAEMFLLAAIGREDVFSYGDVGLKRGIEKLYDLSEPDEEKIESIVIKWSPYRTWGSRILWRVVDS